MPDDRRNGLIPYDVDAVASWDLPHPQMPSLPTTSGALGTRMRILRKDTEYVEQSARKLRARAAQTDAMRDVVLAHIGLARVMTDLAAIGEICSAQYLRGRRQRA